MSQYPNQTRPWELEYGRESTGETSLPRFFNAVYAWMAVGLAVTAVVAYGLIHNPALFRQVVPSQGVAIFYGLAAFGIAMAAQFLAMRVSSIVTLMLFMVYAALIGIVFSGLLAQYRLSTVGAAFTVTAGTFAGMSVLGLVTKRDLSSVHSILIMCVWGLLLASVVNIFVASNAFSWMLTYAVLAVFIGLTVTQTQALKNLAYQYAGDSTMTSRLAAVGSLMLYIAFINIFISILRIMGDRK